jgi:hypothetical protein
MRAIIALILLAATSCFADHDILDDAPRSGVTHSPDHRWKVRFRQTAPDDEWKNCGEVTVYHHGRRLLRHCIPRLVSRAAWSPDSKYCVFTTINARGHQAWSYMGVVFSTADHSFRWLDRAVGSINAPDFHFKAPDIVVVRVVDKAGKVSAGKEKKASLHEIVAKLPHDNEI